MNEDIRISVDFLDHHKTARLEKELGFQGVKALLRLWFYAAKYRPDGHLSNMDNDDIIIAARWKENPELLINALTHKGKAWLEWKEDHYYLHHWVERNGYASHAEKRSEIARKAADARWNRKEKQSLDALSIDTAMLDECVSNADAYAPSPNPFPFPNPKDKKTSPLPKKNLARDVRIPFAEIIEYLNSVTNKKFSASGDQTKRHISARWSEGFRLDDFKRVIDIKSSKWLHDPSMNKYLRPETIFSPKFEGYLNESTEGSGSDDDIYEQQIKENNAEIYKRMRELKLESEGKHE